MFLKTKQNNKKSRGNKKANMVATCTKRTCTTCRGEFAFKQPRKTTTLQNPNSEVSSPLEVSSTRRYAREERKQHRAQTQSAKRRKQEEADRLEAAFSFFLITLGIKLHQRAESQLIPYFNKTDPIIS